MRKAHRSIVCLATISLTALISTGCAFIDGGSTDLKNAQNDVMDNATSLCQPGKNTTQGEMRAKLTESILRYNTAWIAADVPTMKKYPTTGAIMGTVATTCQEASELMDNMSKQINKYNLGVQPTTTPQPKE